jgi:hypothetical protein
MSNRKGVGSLNRFSKTMQWRRVIAAKPASEGRLRQANEKRLGRKLDDNATCL